MSEIVDPFQQLGDDQERLALLQAQGRDAALERGRRYGVDEAVRRGEDDQGRVQRATAYAAWEYDGKPSGYGDRYQIEFGLKSVAELDNVLRGGPDPKDGKR